jgi:broad specificity phosphatase PhoE
MITPELVSLISKQLDRQQRSTIIDMAPIIHIVRHSQGYHNVDSRWNLPDPNLTETGKQQCIDLASQTEQLRSNVTHLVASPSLRTIQTCALTFASVIETGKQIILLPDIQEVAADACNIPATLQVIQETHGSLVDTALLTPGFRFRGTGSRLLDDFEAVRKRAREARKWLRALARGHGEKASIVVVTHGDFIRMLTMDPYSKWFRNSELRSYRFVNWEDDDEEADLELITRQDTLLAPR